MKKELLFSAFISNPFRKILLVIFFAVSINKGLGQNIFIDNTRKKLEAAKDDTSRVMFLSEMAYSFRFTSIDSSINYATSALSLAQQIKYLRGEANALSVLGVVLYEKGELPRSLQNELSAKQIA